MPCRIDAENVSAQVNAIGDVEVPPDPVGTIEKFINQAYGWDRIVQEFTDGAAGKEGKERDLSDAAKGIDERTLAYIGAARKRIVLNAFDCFKRPGQNLQAPGSTTLVSDFDVCILGKDSCFTMWLMFKHFQCTYKTTLPVSSDVNLYSNGTYGPLNLKPKVANFEPMYSRHAVFLDSLVRASNAPIDDAFAS